MLKFHRQDIHDISTEFTVGCKKNIVSLRGTVDMVKDCYKIIFEEIQ